MQPWRAWMAAAFLFSTAGAVSALAELSVADVFTDWAVVQRSRPVPVSGRADADAEVVVTLAGEEVRGQADAKGRWSVELPMSDALGGDHTLTVKAGAETIEVNHLTFGDVWLCSGQSNMDMPLKKTTDGAELLAAPPKNVRVLNLPPRPRGVPETGFSSKEVRWRMLTKATAPDASAVAAHFAAQLQPELGVPVGLVIASFGGTTIQAWMPTDSLRAIRPDDGSFAKREETLAKLTADPTLLATGPGVSLQQGAGTLFDGVIYPLAPLRFTGVVWYQGEQNAGSGRDYRELLPGLIAGWRGFFKQPELGFVVVQLPNFQDRHEGSWAPVREAQMLATRDPRVGMAVTIDLGDAKDIHPTRKAEVGRRVALAARAVVYGHPVAGRSPVVAGLVVGDGEAWLKFDHAAGGFAVNEEPTGFTVAGADKTFYPALARVEGERVVVRAAEVPEPVAVRYLWRNAPEATPLFGRVSGLPLAPFRTDDWPAGDLSPWLNGR